MKASSAAKTEKRLDSPAFSAVMPSLIHIHLLPTSLMKNINNVSYLRSAGWHVCRDIYTQSTSQTSAKLSVSLEEVT